MYTAMMLDVVMKDKYNGLDLGKALAAEEQRLQKNLPVGITFVKGIDQSEVIKNAVDEFQIKFFVALLVVMIVSLASLGWRAGFLVAGAVPITTSATPLGILLPGISLPCISLRALILSPGLLVDD